MWREDYLRNPSKCDLEANKKYLSLWQIFKSNSYSWINHAVINLVASCDNKALRRKMNESAKTRYIFKVLVYW